MAVYYQSTTTTLYTCYKPFSRTTCLSRWQTDKPFWISLMQRWWDGSGIGWTICKSFAPHFWQITMPTPHHFLRARMLLLPPNQQRQSTDGICCTMLMSVFNFGIALWHTVSALLGISLTESVASCCGDKLCTFSVWFASHWILISMAVAILCWSVKIIALQLNVRVVEFCPYLPWQTLNHIWQQSSLVWKSCAVSHSNF